MTGRNNDYNLIFNFKNDDFHSKFHFEIYYFDLLLKLVDLLNNNLDVVLEPVPLLLVLFAGLGKELLGDGAKDDPSRVTAERLKIFKCKYSYVNSSYVIFFLFL